MTTKDQIKLANLYLEGMDDYHHRPSVSYGDDEGGDDYEGPHDELDNIKTPGLKNVLMSVHKSQANNIQEIYENIIAMIIGEQKAGRIFLKVRGDESRNLNAASIQDVLRVAEEMGIQL